MAEFSLPLRCLMDNGRGRRLNFLGDDHRASRIKRSLAVGSESIGIAVGIDGDSGDQAGRAQLVHGQGPAVEAFLVFICELIELDFIFFGLESAQRLIRTLADLQIFVRLVNL